MCQNGTWCLEPLIPPIPRYINVHHHKTNTDSTEIYSLLLIDKAEMHFLMIVHIQNLWPQPKYEI